MRSNLHNIHNEDLKKSISGFLASWTGTTLLFQDTEVHGKDFPDQVLKEWQSLLNNALHLDGLENRLRVCF